MTDDPKILRVDALPHKRPRPQIHLACPMCGHHLRLWLSEPLGNVAALSPWCPHCRMFSRLSCAVAVGPGIVSAPPPDVLFNSGRPKREYRLTSRREDRPRLSRHAPTLS